MRRFHPLPYAIAMGCLCPNATGQQLLDSTLLDMVPSAFPVGFDLLTRGNRLYAAYYDSSHSMIIASKPLDSTGFARKALPTKVGWDSHNGVVLELDDRGHVHVSGNMHAVPLIYFRTTAPGDVFSLEKVPQMVLAAKEDRVTYPQFISVGGRLHFFYRHGSSGDGVWYLNRYDANPTVRTWSAMYGGASFFGNAGSVNAYFRGPVQGPDNRYHVVFMWRDTPDAASNHDIGYMRTQGPNLDSWESAGGAALTLPVTTQAVSTVVDPVAATKGLINTTQNLGFDSRGNAIVSYHKYDAAGVSQLYNARWSVAERKWQVVQASDWKEYRWDFGGGGSIVVEISVGGVSLQDGKLVQTWSHSKFGSGKWILDEATLKPMALEKAFANAASPAAADLIEKHLWSRGEGADPTIRYALRWATQEPNRDVKPDVIPPDSRLMLLKYKVATSGLRPRISRAKRPSAGSGPRNGRLRFRKPGVASAPRDFDGSGRVVP